MLKPCTNPACSVHFAIGASKCPACGTPALPVAPDFIHSTGSPLKREVGLTAEELRGKQILMTYIALILATDVATSLLTLSVRGGNSYARGVRLILSVFLCSALFCGNVIAKRIAIGLYGLASAIGIVLFGLLSVSGLGVPGLKGNPFVIVPGIALVSLYVSFVIVLLNSRSVNSFMAYQRRTRGGLVVEQTTPDIAPAESHACPMCGATIDTHAPRCPACGEHLAGRHS